MNPRQMTSALENGENNTPGVVYDANDSGTGLPIDTSGPITVPYARAKIQYRIRLPGDSMPPHYADPNWVNSQLVQSPASPVAAATDASGSATTTGSGLGDLVTAHPILILGGLAALWYVLSGSSHATATARRRVSFSE